MCSKHRWTIISEQAVHVSSWNCHQKATSAICSCGISQRHNPDFSKFILAVRSMVSPTQRIRSLGVHKTAYQRL